MDTWATHFNAEIFVGDARRSRKSTETETFLIRTTDEASMEILSNYIGPKLSRSSWFVEGETQALVDLFKEEYIGRNAGTDRFSEQRNQLNTLMEKTQFDLGSIAIGSIIVKFQTELKVTEMRIEASENEKVRIIRIDLSVEPLALTVIEPTDLVGAIYDYF